MNEKEKAILDIIGSRRIIEGPIDKFMGINPVRYPWAIELVQNMMKNEWFPKRVSLVKDATQYELEGDSGTRIAVDRALSFLTTLDGIQVENLTTNIIDHITDPTIKLCLYRQTWEEALHVISYATVIESVCKDQIHIYDMYRVNPVLKEKNDFIMAQALAMREKGFSAENFIYAVVSNIVLEGIYFHSGFLLFYVLEKLHNKFLGCADMIRYIQRDETSHVVLFTNIFNALKVERPELFTKEVYDNIESIVKSSVQLEAAWGKHIIESGVPGLNDKTIEDYIKFLADKRLVDIGMKKLYSVENPYPWVDLVSTVNSSESNFFETKGSSYSKKPLKFNDDD